MILVRTFNGGSLSFRTQKGTVQASLKDGFMYVDVDNVIAKQMQILHAFHRPPASFSLEEPKKEIIVEKPAKKVTPKRTTRKRSKKTS